jgi:hypothetical protein
MKFSLFHESHVLIIQKKCPDARNNAFRETFSNSFFTWATVDDAKHVIVPDLTPSLVHDGVCVAVFVFIIS